MSAESFIGGFTSGFLAKDFMGVRAGYGLYFTSQRLFGVSAEKWSGGSLGGGTGGLIQGQLIPSLTPDQSATVIAELERAKDFELSKAEIRILVLKKPGPIGLGLGKLTIEPNQGQSVSYRLRSPIAYDRLLVLAKTFSPELLKTKPFLSL